MSPGKDWKILSIMITKISGLPGGMTEVAGFGGITIISYPPVIIIRFSLIVFMTINTVKDLVGCRISMTCSTIVPFILMVPGEYREKDIMIVK